MGKEKVVLSIAGSDSGGGAGIQADIKSISALGGYACTVITSITSQNTVGVQRVFPVPVDLVISQLNSIFSDFDVGAIKIGLLGRRDLVEAIATYFKDKTVPIVLDPVLVSTSGDSLGSKNSMTSLVDELFPLVALVTPNIFEAQVLTGLNLENFSQVELACLKISQMGVPWVLIKGGDRNSRESIDVLYDQKKEEFHYFKYVMIPSKNTHGTGCSLSSAIAYGLSRGKKMPLAVEEAKNYISGAIEHGKNKKFGAGHGPIDHFWSKNNSQPK